MNQLKQNIMVVSILFLSLLTSVALSYAITPVSAAADQKQTAKTIIVEKKTVQKKLSLAILVPKVVK